MHRDVIQAENVVDEARPLARPQEAEKVQQRTHSHCVFAVRQRLLQPSVVGPPECNIITNVFDENVQQKMFLQCVAIVQLIGIIGNE